MQPSNEKRSTSTDLMSFLPVGRSWLGVAALLRSRVNRGFPRTQAAANERPELRVARQRKSAGTPHQAALPVMALSDASRLSPPPLGSSVALILQAGLLPHEPAGGGGTGQAGTGWPQQRAVPTGAHLERKDPAGGTGPPPLEPPLGRPRQRRADRNVISTGADISQGRNISIHICIGSGKED